MPAVNVRADVPHRVVGEAVHHHGERYHEVYLPLAWR
jgi:hypothetical protein